MRRFLETTAVPLSWTGHLLALYPQVDARLANELRAALGGRLPAVADLPALRCTGTVVTCRSTRFSCWTNGRFGTELVGEARDENGTSRGPRWAWRS